MLAHLDIAVRGGANEVANYDAKSSTSSIHTTVLHLTIRAFVCKATAEPRWDHSVEFIDFVSFVSPNWEFCRQENCHILRAPEPEQIGQEVCECPYSAEILHVERNEAVPCGRVDVFDAGGEARGNEIVCLGAPTGSGKTVIATPTIASFVVRSADQGQRTESCGVCDPDVPGPPSWF